MDIIEKQNKYITNEKHIESLYILQKVMSNYINGIFVVSKKMNMALHKNKDKEQLESDYAVLDKINKSIKYFESI